MFYNYVVSKEEGSPEKNKVEAKISNNPKINILYKIITIVLRFDSAHFVTISHFFCRLTEFGM